jgi:peptide/nickel transport system substrate-binding protein
MGQLERGISRRSLLSRMLALGGIGAAGLLTACQPQAPSAPSVSQPTTPPGAAKPAPTTAAGAPTVAPAAAAKPTTVAAGATTGQADSRPFVLLDGQDAVTLDPHSAPDVAYSYNLQRGPAEALLQYVVKPDGSVDVAPLLAKTWTVKDNQVFTLHLQEGVKFQDGTPFNSAAVKFNFDRIMALKLTPAGRLPKITSIDTPNDSTVVFTVDGQSTDFQYPLTQMLMISPKGIQDHAADDNGRKWADENIVGTGPYLIESRTKGSETVLTRNKDYWRGWDGNHLDKISVRVVKEPATQRLMLERGDAHLAKNIAFADIDALANAPGVVIEQSQQPGNLFLMLRFRGPLTDVNVRKAMAYAYDYDGLIKSTFRGKSDPPSGFLYSKHPFHDPSIPPMKQDMALAKDFLAKSAYPNGGFNLSVLILPAFGFYQPAEAQILQDNLKELKINLDIQPMSELATFYASVEDEQKGADMWAWSGSAQSPDHNFQARRQWHSKFKRPAGVNGGYSNPRVDAILEQDQKTADPEQRKTLWFELQKILLDDMPDLTLGTPFQFLTKRAELQNMPLNVFDLVPNYYNAWLKKSG